MDYPIVRSQVLTMPLSSLKQTAQHLECVSHSDADHCAHSCHSLHSDTSGAPAASTKLPLLEELLDLAAVADFVPDYVPNSGVDVLGMFTQYLLRIHCLESLEFVLAIMNFVLEPDRDAWEAIYDMFIHQNSPRELNIPASIKENLSRYLNEGYPDLKSLLQCKKFVYDDMLINLYHEFIKEIKASFVGEGDDRVLLHRKLVRAGVEYSDTIQIDLRLGCKSNSGHNDRNDDDDDDEDNESDIDEDEDVDGSHNHDYSDDSNNSNDDDGSSNTRRTTQPPLTLDFIQRPHPPPTPTPSSTRGKSAVIMTAREINGDPRIKPLDHQPAGYSNEVSTLVSLIKKRVSLKRPFRTKRFRSWCRWPDEGDEHVLQ